MKKLLVLLICTSLFARLNAQNLLVNPGFESGGTGWFIAAVSGNPAVFSLDNTDFIEGTVSLLVDAGAGDSAFLAQEVPVTPGKTYHFTWWLKADSLEHYMLPFIKVRQDTISRFDSYFMPNGNTNGWIKQEARILIPDSTNNIVIFFGLLGGGVIRYDAFSFVELSDTTWSQFTVDFNSTGAPFKELFSANGIGPGNPSQPFNHIQKFQDLGIDYLRTHDFAIAFDHSVIFPDTTRDPLDPTAYYWHTTDSVIADIYNAGGKVFYRFGQSFDMTHTFNVPPLNYDKWAQVCVQILKHYQDGWSGGFSYDIDYAEIWNEPDLWDFWTGSTQDYIRLYRKAAKAIHQYDPGIRVGGPAISNVYNQSFVTEFLDSVSTYSIPMDFFSYHLYYFHNPRGFLETNEFVRQKLDSAGLTGVELINSEWNSYMFSWDTPSDWGMDDPFNAASAIGAMVYMQQSTIGKFFRYAFDNYWFGMVDWFDQWRHSGIAMLSLRTLMDYQTQLETTGSDSLGTVIIASESSDNLSTRVLVAANSGSANGYRITFQNSAQVALYICEQYRTDAQHFNEYSGTLIFTESEPWIEVSATPPFVDYWEISCIVSSAGMNANGMLVYPNPFVSDLTICFPEMSTGQGELVLSDALGRIVHRETVYSGTNIVRICPPVLESGMYYLVLNENGKDKLICPVVKTE